MLRHRIFLSWLQLSRDRARLIVALLGIGFAGMLMFIQLGFQAALFDSNTLFHQLLKADLVLISPQARNLPNMSTFPRRRLYQAMNLAEVESGDALYVQYADWKNPQNRKNSAILVIGFDPGKSVLNLDEVNQNLDQIKLLDTLMFDRAARGEYDPTVARLERGEAVTTEIKGREVQIKGLFTIGASFAADAYLITSDLNFLRIFTDRKLSQVSVGLITLKPNVNCQKTASALKAKLPDDVKVMTRQEFAEFEKKYWMNNTPVGFIFSLGTAIGFIVGVVIVYQILYNDVSEHLSEYATLKGMGYTNLFLVSLVFQEALILAILGYFPGFSLSMILYELTKNATRLPIEMPPDRALFVLVLTVLMCCFSGVFSIRKLRSADPADIF